MPAAAADDDDGWLYRKTPSLRPPGSPLVCRLLGEEMCSGCAL